MRGRESERQGGRERELAHLREEGKLGPEVSEADLDISWQVCYCPREGIAAV